MMHALSSGSFGGLGVLLGVTSDHRVIHPPLMVHCVQGEWLNLPCDTPRRLRDRMNGSPVEASYPCSLGLMGSTSHLINEQGNGVRDHSSTIDGRIIVSTVLPMLG